MMSDIFLRRSEVTSIKAAKTRWASEKYVIDFSMEIYFIRDVELSHCP